MMETETLIQMIATGLLALFQFLLMVIVGLVGFIFRSSINHLKTSVSSALDGLNKTVQEIKQDRMLDKQDRKSEADNIYSRLQTIEKNYADRSEVQTMIDNHKCT
jgi:hypothetical protein